MPDRPSKNVVSFNSYAEYTEILYMVNSRFKYGSDYDFARELINIPLLERYDWLFERVRRSCIEENATIQDMVDIETYLEHLKELRVHG